MVNQRELSIFWE